MSSVNQWALMALKYVIVSLWQTTPATKSIVVQFVYQGKRSAVLEKTWRFRFESADVDLTSDSPFYVNKHLSPVLKKLLGKATATKEGSRLESPLEWSNSRPKNRLVSDDFHNI